MFALHIAERCYLAHAVFDFSCSSAITPGKIGERARRLTELRRAFNLEKCSRNVVHAFFWSLREWKISDVFQILGPQRSEKKTKENIQPPSEVTKKSKESSGKRRVDNQDKKVAKPMLAKAALNKVSCWKSKLWPDTLQSTVSWPSKIFSLRKWKVSSKLCTRARSERWQQ